MTYTIQITVDYNDGDYITNMIELEAADFERFKRVVNVIKTHGPKYHNWDSYGVLPAQMYPMLIEDDVEWFSNLMPVLPENEQMHTIDNISYAPQVKWQRLL